jgi:hypothetical protein
MVAPVVADSVPTAGEIAQLMVAVLPVSVAVNGAAAPPAVTVAVVGLTVSPGEGLLLPLSQPAATAKAARSAGMTRIRARIFFSLFRVVLGTRVY